MAKAIKYTEKKLGRPRKGVGWSNDPERVIVAKFKSYCTECYEDTLPGEWVLWTPGQSGVKHQKCKY